MQPYVWQALPEREKGVNHGFNILNRVNPDDCRNIDIAIRLLGRDMVKPLNADSVANDLLLIRVAAQFRLNVRITLKQRRYIVRAAVGTMGKHVEHVNPLLPEMRGNPLSTQDFFLSLTGINSMLGQYVGPAVFP